MSKNRANMLTGSNNPSLARADINDMFADLGYGSSGDASVVTTTGEANKLLKFSSIANTLLHFLRIRKSSTSAFNVQDDSSVDVFNIDTTNKIATSYNQKISGLAGTGNRMVVADASGNLSASGVITKLIAQQPYNYTAVYGINYINSGTGGQSITLPVAVSGAEVEIISKTQGANTFLEMSGSNKIYDINGNNVTSTYTGMYALFNVKRIKFVGSIQVDRVGAILNSGAVDWVVVEREDNLAGTGSRMVVADSNGNLSAPLNKFVSTYVEGTLFNVSGSTWTVLMECPTGKTTLAITTNEAFEGTTNYYSQAEFARALGGVPVAIYSVSGAGSYITAIRLNGNNIEVMQTAGATTIIQYRYKIENSRV